MGLILTSYGEDAYAHEGYAALVLNDGTLTSTYSDETEPRTVGLVVAACSCAWAGATRYPTAKRFDEAAEELALAEWERDHARPTLERLRADRWIRLCRLLQRLAASTQAAMAATRFTALPPTNQIEILDATVRELDGALSLARELREPLDGDR